MTRYCSVVILHLGYQPILESSPYAVISDPAVCDGGYTCCEVVRTVFDFDQQLEISTLDLRAEMRSPRALCAKAT
jgi:ferredoxin